MGGRSRTSSRGHLLGDVAPELLALEVDHVGRSIGGAARDGCVVPQSGDVQDPAPGGDERAVRTSGRPGVGEDRKSTRLNSSHSQISYAVFCLKKKKE